jgi:protein-disulfide isomerase
MDPPNASRSTGGRSSVVVTATSSKQAFQRAYLCILPPPSISRAILLTASLAALLFGHPARPLAAEQVDVLAEIAGVALTAQEVDQALGPQLGKLYQQIYEVKRRKLDELIAEKLLRQEAAKRGLSVQQLLDAEVNSKADQVTEQEVESLHQKNRTKLRGPEKKIRERIRSELVAERAATQREAFIRQLRAERRVVVYLQPPIPIRVSLDGGEKAAVKGLPEAPVVIIEFSDFQCPFCRKALTELDRVRAAYPKDVKLVYRHFPIDRLHPQAWLAAQAAECAGAEGRFWEYHDRLFAQSDLSLPKLKELAQGLKLDLPAFEQCLNGEWARTRVAQDVEAGKRAGVSGTPTFFINGRVLAGAQPFESLRAIIEQELATRAVQSMGRK